MWQNITPVIVAICVSATLLEPVAARAQTFSIGSSGPSSLAPTPARRWIFRNAEAAELLDRTRRPADFHWRDAIPRNSWTGSQLHPQIKAPRHAKGLPTARSQAYRGAQRALAAFALGFVGFYVGGITAFGFAESCECGGNDTEFIGGAIGAAAGAATGLLLVR